MKMMTNIGIIPEIEDPVDSVGHAIFQQPPLMIACYVSAYFHGATRFFSQSDWQGTVGPNGRTTGSYNDNSMYNTLVYDVEFGDGGVRIRC
jgi:hypothetical protein